MTKKTQLIIDIIQWILIIGLICLCIFIFRGNKDIKQEEYIKQTEDTYIKIYNSQKISELEKINKTLYDSIKTLKNVESAVEIKYVYRYKTDTIFVEDFNRNDSIYEYENTNDTITTNVTIVGNDVKWCQVETKIKDKFTIITSEKDGNITTQINHSTNIDDIKVDTWHRNNKKWTDNFFYGPSIGVGYGLFNKKPDLYVGFSIGYKF